MSKAHGGAEVANREKNESVVVLRLNNDELAVIL
jgi:hypothetical protein